MYDKLYSPIPDIRAYLNRLQVDAPEQTDFEYLDNLIYIHQQKVVFENMDSYEFHKPVSLEIPAVFEKVVTNHRGGYCFELNTLFTQLLKDLGYHAYGCMGRIVRNKTEVPPVLHRVNVVELDGKKYFYDVGFGGPMPAGLLLIEDGFSRTMHGETYHMKKTDEYWWTVSRTTSSGEIENVLQFYPMPQHNVTFIPNNEYCGCCPDSIFTQIPFLNRRTADGSIGVMGNTLTIIENGTVTKTEIHDKHELYEIMEKYFELKLPL